jgi:hypothetical protein
MKRFVITEDERKHIKSLYEQSNVVVSISGEQPYPNGTDWDLVHGILGSKRIDDDLEERVATKLKEGNYRVTDVKISSYVKGDKVITNGSVTLVPDNQNPDVAFTTRGSIGGDYLQRHDGQVSGLSDRLSSYYKGTSRQFGPFEVTVQGTNVKYKQSFFAISKNPKSSNGGQTIPNQNTNQKDIKDIRHNDDPTKLTAELKGLGVIYNPDIISRPGNVIVKYQKTGDNPVSLSFIYSNAGEKEKVLNKVKETNTIEREIDYSISGYDGYIVIIKR